MIDLPIFKSRSVSVNPAHVVTIERAQSPERDALNSDAKEDLLCRVYLSDGRYLLAAGTVAATIDLLFPTP